jgi:outer membrane protein assembly factor BamB
MNSRTITVIVLAIVLMVLVMGAALAITFLGAANRDKWAIAETWSQPASSVQSMKITNLMGEAKTDLFVQAGSTVKVFDASGKLVFSKDYPGTLATTMGDVDGDGAQEVMVYYASGTSAVAAIRTTEAGPAVWQTGLVGLGAVGRAAAVDFDGTAKYGVVVGDMSGKLVAISNTGKELWRYEIPTSELRGLDTILMGKPQLIAAAEVNGSVVALDGKGKPVWTFTTPGGLRRMRTYELTAPGQSAVLIGGENGTLVALEGATGKTLWTANAAQPVSEIRLAELDGNPGTREVVAGGKNGGVWAYSQTGQLLFSASVGSKNKVMEIASLDVEGTSRDLVAVGAEDGSLTFFDSKGHQIASPSYSAPINRILADKFMKDRQFLVADNSQLRALKPTKQTAPFWYSPLLAGLLACVVIAGVAFFIASIKPAPTLQISAEQMTVEAQKARRIMLHESLEDLKRMKAEVPPESYLARLKDLRAQMADAEANLVKLGVPLKAETIKCPNCGGTLDLGTDRCEYCGQVVIT